MTNYSAVPYVLISGSYQQNRTNDKLCNYLGNKLAQHNFNIISGGSKPAIKISEGMNRMLTDLNQYENSRIVTVYRRKGSEDELKIKRIGNIRFEGNDIQEMREYLFINSKAMVVRWFNENKRRNIVSPRKEFACCSSCDDWRHCT